jgi:DNA-binding HxlR family transcriptional regulator
MQQRYICTYLNTSTNPKVCMAAVKTSSTNYLNKKQIQTQCPVTFTLDKIGGRWKTIIIYHLLSGKKRYGELKKLIPSITEKMLIQQLRQLEADNMIERTVMPVVPPHVEYNLSKAGNELAPILEAMCKWADKHNV